MWSICMNGRIPLLTWRPAYSRCALQKAWLPLSERRDWMLNAHGFPRSDQSGLTLPGLISALRWAHGRLDTGPSNAGGSRLRRLSMTQLNHDRKLVVVGRSRYNLTLVIEAHDLAQREVHLFACSR